MPNIQKIPIIKGWRWKVDEDPEMPYIKVELQRNIWFRWMTMGEFQFNLHMIRRKPTIYKRVEEWYKPDFVLSDRLNSKWKDYCKTHKVS